MPFSSAGPHYGMQAVMDKLLLLVALAVPCAIAGVRFVARMNRPAARLLSRQISGSTEAWPEEAPTRQEIERSGSFRSLGGSESKVPSVMLMGSATDSDTLRNALSGATISLGCIPEAISFSMIVGLSPLSGIWAGVFMGLYTSLLGGRPGMISCSSGATAVVLATVAHDHGFGAMALSVVFCGVLEILAGIFYISRLIALAPAPVMLGFCNGLAVVICRSQLRQFRHHGDGDWLEGPVLHGMILTIAVSIGIALAAPRMPVVGKLLPGPLVAIIVAVAFSCAISPWFPQRTLSHAAGPETFLGGVHSLPTFNFPPANVDWASGTMWAAVIMTGARMALVGLVESLLTVKLLDQITGTVGSTRRECMAQGFGNVIAGLFGTQGGCALIGQSLINVSGGGVTRLSSFIMSAGLASSVIFFAPVVGKIPVAALVGLMFLAAVNTFAWGSLGLLHLVAWTDLIVILTVTGVTIVVDLATAIVTGLFISALAFAWSAAKEVKLVDEPEGENTRVFRLQGPLFFGSSMSFQSRVRPERIPEAEVVLDFSGGKVLDHSALDAIVKTIDRLHLAGKIVHFRSLPADARLYLKSMSEAKIPDDRLPPHGTSGSFSPCDAMEKPAAPSTPAPLPLGDD